MSMFDVEPLENPLFSELDCVNENTDFRGADIRMVRTYLCKVFHAHD